MRTAYHLEHGKDKFFVGDLVSFTYGAINLTGKITRIGLYDMTIEKSNKYTDYNINVCSNMKLLKKGEC